MRIIGFVLISFLSISVYSQKYDIGLSLKPGISKFHIENPGELKVKWAFSGDVGVFLHRKISSKSEIGIEILLTELHSKEIFKKDIVSTITINNIPIEQKEGEYDIVADFKNAYLSFPVFYKFNINQFFIKAGLQTMVAVDNSIEVKSFISENRNSIQYVRKGHSKDFNRLDFGPKLGLGFTLSQSIFLIIEYYHGMTNLAEDLGPGSRYNRQATLGLQYSLTQKKKISEQ